MRRIIAKYNKTHCSDAHCCDNYCIHSALCLRLLWDRPYASRVSERRMRGQGPDGLFAHFPDLITFYWSFYLETRACMSEQAQQRHNSHNANPSWELFSQDLNFCMIFSIEFLLHFFNNTWPVNSLKESSQEQTQCTNKLLHCFFNIPNEYAS